MNKTYMMTGKLEEKRIMKKKKAILVLSLVLATTAVTAWAASPDRQQDANVSESIVGFQPVDSENNTHVSDDGIVTPDVIDKAWSATMINGSGSSANSYFSVNPGNGYLKLHLANYSSTSVRVTVTHIDSGYVYFDKTINPTSSKDYFSWLEGAPQGLRTGSYLIQYIGGAHSVNGEHWGKLASSTADF